MDFFINTKTSTPKHQHQDINIMNSTNNKTLQGLQQELENHEHKLALYSRNNHRDDQINAKLTAETGSGGQEWIPNSRKKEQQLRNDIRFLKALIKSTEEALIEDAKLDAPINF